MRTTDLTATQLNSDKICRNHITEASGSCFKTGFHVAQASLELLILLLPHAESWGYYAWFYVVLGIGTQGLVYTK